MNEAALHHQKNYRILLQAMSRPGRLTRLALPAGTSCLSAAMAVGQCLLDHEVTLCVTGDEGAQPLQSALVAATRARTASLEKADFLFISGAEARGAAARAKRGTLETPENGATLVYCMHSRSADEALRCPVRLSGPGIPAGDGIVPQITGIGVEEFRELMAVNADYPMGVDAIFLRPNGELICIPRSTRILVR